MITNHIKPVRIIKAASACVWRDGEVLLIQRGNAHGKGQWSLPGGKVELGESDLETAQRELLEETGINANLTQSVGVFDIEMGDFTYSIHCFTGHYLSGEAKAASDAQALAWVRPTVIEQYSLAPLTLNAVNLASNLIKL
jgi:8-oxo-dGTP diphosphatase